MLASWNSVEIPDERGRFPLAERYDEDLACQLSTQTDSLERQLRLMSWFYVTLPEDHIIRYEDIVSSGGGALSTIDPAAHDLSEQLSSKNRNPIYDHKEMRALGERLLRSEGSYWRVYSRESVQALLA